MTDSPNQQNPNSQQGRGNEINIKIADEELKGSYSNLLRITHTHEEFILDFINMVPPQGIVTSRVVTSPGHIKRIIAALSSNLQRYEDAHGEVQMAPDPTGSPVH